MFARLKKFLLQQQVTPTVTIREGNENEENESRVVSSEIDEVTLQDVWNCGNDALESFQENGIVSSENLTKFALEICNRTIPSLLTLAKEAPMVGPVAGVLLDFYSVYKEVGENRESFVELEGKVRIATMWLYDSRELFVEDSEMFEEGKAIKEEFKQFCLAVSDAKRFVQKIQRRFKSESAVNRLKSWVMSKSDSEQLTLLIASVNEATTNFKIGLSTHQALMKAKEKLESTLKIVCAYGTDSAVIEKAELFVDGTREWLFQEVDAWVADKSKTSSGLFWLQATAGMGKTVFTAALSQRLRLRGQLLGIYMFQFHDQYHSTVSFVTRMLARQVSFHNKELRGKIVEAAKKLKDDLRQDDPLHVFKKLIVEPLQGYQPKQPMVILLDALDEIGAEGSANRKMFLEMLTSKSYFLQLPSWVKIFVSARPENDIVKQLCKVSILTKRSYNSSSNSEISSNGVNGFTHIIEENDERHVEDLRKYLEYSLREIDIIEGNEELVQLLLKKSQGRFIYTAVVSRKLVEWLNDSRDTSTLETLDKAEIEKVITSLPEGINECYEKSFRKLYEKQVSCYLDRRLLKNFCQLMVASLAPLPVSVVRELLGLTTKKDFKNFSILKEGVSMMFLVRKGESNIECFYPLHKSVLDWLCSESTDYEYRCDLVESNNVLLLQLYTKLLLLDPQEVENASDNCGDFIESCCKKLLAKPWFEWFGFKECPQSPSSFHHEESLLTVYAVKYLPDHMDFGGYETYCLLTSLSYIQAALEACGLIWLRKQFEKRSDTDTLNGMKKKELLNSMVKFCNLLLGAKSPINEYVNDCWSKEICTQIVARLNPTTDISMEVLITDASNYIERNGGMLLHPPQCFVGPDSACEAIIALSFSITFVIASKHNESELQHSLLCEVACNKTIFVYETTSWQVLQTLDGHDDAVLTMCALSDGRRIVSGSLDKTLRIWNLESGACEKVLKGHSADVGCLCELQDGRVVSGSSDQTLRVWNIDDGECVKILENTSFGIISLRVLLDGCRVVCGASDNTLRVWDVDNGLCKKVFVGHNDGISSLCLLLDGRVVSGSYDATVRVWNIDNGECEKILEGHTECVTSVCVLTDHRLVSSSTDKTIRVWNVHSGECINVIKDGLGPVVAMCLFSESFVLVVSGSSNERIQVINTNVSGSKSFEFHSNLVTTFCEPRSGQIVSGSSDKTLRIWNVDRGECQKVLKGHSKFISSLCVLSDGRIVSGSGDATIRVWNLESGECEKVLEGHLNGVSSLCVLSDNRVVSGALDKTLRIWNVDTGECTSVLEGHSKGVLPLCALLDDRVVSGSYDATMRIWNASTGICDKVLKGHSKVVTALCRLKDGRLLSGSHDAVLRIWNADTGECEMVIDKQIYLVSSICVFSDGRVLIASLTGALRIWNFETMTCEIESTTRNGLFYRKLFSGEFSSFGTIDSARSGCFVDSQWSTIAAHSFSFVNRQCSRICIGCSDGSVVFATVHNK